MLRSRLPAESRQSRRTPPELPAPPVVEGKISTQDLLFRSWAGRLFLTAAALKLLIAIVRRIVDVPTAIDVLSSLATIALALSVGYFVWRLFTLVKRRLLWRVRRKLILSYIFIGVVPALLIVAFFMLGAWVVSTNVSAFLFRDGYDDVTDYARLAAEAAASEVARTPATAPETVARIQRNTSRLYRSLSIAFVPTAADSPAAITAGEWNHTEAPAFIPDWVTKRADGFTGTIATVHPERANDVELIIRSVKPVTK